MPQQDAIIVGSGPNGLAAAIELARAGWSVVVYEARPTVGGGTRTAELTRPGALHDVCSAIHPMAASSPFFAATPLAEHGLKWIHPDLPLAHPFDDGSAAVVSRDFDETAQYLGADGARWRRLFKPFADNWPKLSRDVLAKIGIPRHPLVTGWFGVNGLQSAVRLSRLWFRGERARGLFAGIAAHSVLPLERIPSAAFGLVLGTAGHAVGWPMPERGSQSISNALASCLRSLGGKVVVDHEVKELADLPSATAVLFDIPPLHVARIAGARLPQKYLESLRSFRYGPGVFKVDWLLSAPVPWRAEACRRAGTVHLGGTLAEIAASERAPWQGELHRQPYVLVAQQSLFDPTRTPDGLHTLWAYCHVANGSAVDATTAIEDQIERFAPGFRDTILERHSMSAPDMERYNANYIGGDINGGVPDIRQLLGRPTLSRDPYSMPARGLFMCSSSTPPGGGVHGMCGYHAARSVLRRFPA